MIAANDRVFNIERSFTRRPRRLRGATDRGLLRRYALLLAGTMMERDPFSTQRDVGLAVGSELSAAGFDDADEIGRGGFGIVYRCSQPGLDRRSVLRQRSTRSGRRGGLH